MQENNFEKRVQQQMEEFKLRPSEAVWEKVEEELRKKKKRRIVFFIFLLAGLSLLSYSGYFLLHNSKSNLVEQNVTTNKKEPNSSNQPAAAATNESTKVKGTEKSGHLPLETTKAATEKNNSGELNNHSTATITTGPDNKQTTVKEKSEPALISEPGFTTKKAQKEENIFSKKRQMKLVKSTGNKNQLVARRDTKNKSNTGIIQKPIPVPEKSQPEQEEVSKPTENKTDVAKSADAEEQPVKEKDPKNQAELVTIDKTKVENAKEKKDSIAKEAVAATTKEEIKPATPKKKKIPAINFGVELSYGISSNRDNLSIGGGQKSMMDYMPNSSPQFNSAGPAPTAIYSLPPSSIKDGNAFRVGVIAEMKLTKRSTISSGLRYAYFSNQIKVGTFKDTSVSFTNRLAQNVTAGAIYRGFQQQEFVNRFHFIQLPLQYELQLNKGLKLPVSWNMGASLGYLVSTNALIYDPASGGIYYHDKSAFNKFHFNLNTGFSFRFGIKNKLQWSLGPELSVGMNKLMKNDYGQKQYLLYGGITGRVIFAKKK